MHIQLYNTSSDASLILYFAVSHLQKIRCHFETMTWYGKGVMLNWFGNLKKQTKTKHTCMVENTSANIVPFIKAFKPNMKLMHDVHIWPTHIYIHDTQESWWTDFFFFLLKSSIKRFIPEISMTAKWDKESTLPRRIKRAAIHHTIFFKVTFLNSEKTNKHKRCCYTNNALLITLRHLKQKGFVTGLEMVGEL